MCAQTRSDADEIYLKNVTKSWSFLLKNIGYCLLYMLNIVKTYSPTFLDSRLNLMFVSSYTFFITIKRLCQVHFLDQYILLVYLFLQLNLIWSQLPD